MKLLLIGIGRWGKNHLKTLTKLVDELYVVDSDSSQLKTCREFSIPQDRLSSIYHDFLDRIDGVDVVTPATTIWPSAENVSIGRKTSSWKNRSPSRLKKRKR